MSEATRRLTAARPDEARVQLLLEAMDDWYAAALREEEATGASPAEAVARVAARVRRWRVS